MHASAVAVLVLVALLPLWHPGEASQHLLGDCHPAVDVTTAGLPAPVAIAGLAPLALVPTPFASVVVDVSPGGAGL